MDAPAMVVSASPAVVTAPSTLMPTTVVASPAVAAACMPSSAAVPAPGRRQAIPALFLVGGEPVKGLPGLLTVLHDNGFDDRECIAWIFLDADLPGRPIDALLENRGSEVKRRAQALAF